MNYNPTLFIDGLNSPFGSLILDGYMYVANSYNFQQVFLGSISKINMTNPTGPGTDTNLNWATTGIIPNPFSISTDGTYLYISNATQGQIQQVLLSDPTILTLLLDEGQIDPVQFCYGLANAGGFLYASLYYSENNIDFNMILQINTTNGNIVQNWATTNLSYPDYLITDGTYLYSSNSIRNGGDPPIFYIVKIEINNPTTNNIIWKNISNGFIVGFATDIVNSYLYITTIANITTTVTNTIYRTLLNSTTTNVSLFSESPLTQTNYIVGISFYNSLLYLSNSQVGQIITISSILVCFRYDTKILTDKGYIPICNLQKGDLIKTANHEYKAIHIIGCKKMVNESSDERIGDQLYICTRDKYPVLFEDLVMTGYHSILVDSFKNDEEMEKTKALLGGKIFITDNKYRLPVCIDERSTIYGKDGTTIIYHFALEHDDERMNYGVYANGLLVESCSKRMMNMFLK